MPSRNTDTRGRRATDLTPTKVGLRGFRRSYIFANAFEFWVALAALATGLTFFVNRDALHDSTVGRHADVLAGAWSVLYFVGGALVLMGLWWSWRPRAWRIELAGLSLMAAAILINGLAVILVRRASGAPTAATFVALAVACGMRARMLLVLTGVQHVRHREKR